MVSLDITETSKSLAVVGGYITLAGLVSYYLKEKLFLCKSISPPPRDSSDLFS